ncbi:LacI family DNA-binding transcriptional regulator [Vibrio sp. Hal054]|uniref:LacI family DNA-binding transcriptional regulator n=1 Tax=Vibrio sp. Hal054 TaxID=3035158 RepID=UPI00301C947F
MRTKPAVPTLDDVAKLAGVSKSAASRALSGKNRPIASDKKARILQAAEELGYVANPFAQSLRESSTGLVAIVVNHIADLSDLTLFDSLIQAIQSLGKQALFIRLRSEDDIAEIKRNPFVHRVDAALIFSDLIEPEEAPTLFFTDKVIMLNGKKADTGLSVTINEELGIEKAVACASHHHVTKAILLCGRKTSVTERQRIESYHKFMECFNIDSIHVAFCDYSYESAFNHLQNQTYSDTSNLGIFCTSDAMAMAAVDFSRSKYPELIQRKVIYGFDNTPFSQMGGYCFSTIGYSKDEFIEMILKLLNKKTFKQTRSRHLSVDTEFYER